MALPYPRRVGAAADVNELLYVIALHQTSQKLRENATVSSTDIVRFLQSECGIEHVAHDDGIRIVRGLGGGGGRGNKDDSQEQNLPESQCTETKTVQTSTSSRKGRRSSSIHLLESLWKSLWRRLFRKGKVRSLSSSDIDTRDMDRSEQVTHKDSSATSKHSRAKVVHHFGGTIAAGSSIQRLGTLETVNETPSTQTPAAGSNAKVLVHLEGDSNNTIRRLGSSEDATTTTLPGLQYSPDESKAKVLVHLGGSLTEAASIRKLDSSSSNKEQETLPTSRVLQYCHDTHEEYLDAVQLMAILLIPTFEEMGNEWNAHEWSTKGHWAFGANHTKDNDRQRPQHLLRLADVLSSMLASVKSNDDESTPTLNTKLVRDLLIAHGEFDRAEDVVLVEQMVEAAHSSTFLLDEEALVNALTLDLNDTTGKRPTVYRDGVRSRRVVTEGESEEDEQSVADDLFPEALHLDMSHHSLTSEITMDHLDHHHHHHHVSARHVDAKQTIAPVDEPVPTIGASSDRHSSLALAVAMVLFLAFMALSFVSLFQRIQFQTSLPLLDEAVRWFGFSMLPMLAGYAVVVPFRIANSPSTRTPLRTLAAVLLAASLTWITSIMIDHGQSYSHEMWNRTIIYTLLILLFAASIGDANASVRSSKQRSATNKIDGILENAHKLLNESRSKEETALKYVEARERYEECGGLFWTWRMLLSGALIDKEGISIAPRLYAIQYVQTACIVFMVYLGLCFIQKTVAGSEEWHGTIASSDLEVWISQVVPTPTQLRMALYPALFVAVVGMVALFLVYVPSYVKTVLQYRCGLVPSFGSPRFVECRRSVPMIYRNVGNAAWGMIGSGFLCFVLVGLFLILFMLPLTRGFMWMLVSWVLALTIATAAKRLAADHHEQRLYNGFFALNPQIANLVTLGLECSYIGLGGGFLIQRVSQLLAGSAFFAGRIDVPTSTSLLGWSNDPSTSFMADLLQHEAHTHPYMERLFEVYKTKLANESFGSEAGACGWRQLFVLSLMPYLQKYRVGAGARRMDRLESQTSSSLASVAEQVDVIATTQATHSLVDNAMSAKEEEYDS